MEDFLELHNQKLKKRIRRTRRRGTTLVHRIISGCFVEKQQEKLMVYCCCFFLKKGFTGKETLHAVVGKISLKKKI